MLSKEAPKEIGALFILPARFIKRIGAPFTKMDHLPFVIPIMGV